MQQKPPVTAAEQRRLRRMQALLADTEQLLDRLVSGEGKVPLEVLEQQLMRLTAIVKGAPPELCDLTAALLRAAAAWLRAMKPVQ